MGTLADFIDKNINVFKIFVRAGKVPASVMSDYRIYIFYKSLSNMPSKMDRYQFTADSNGVSVTSVRNAVKEMEKRISS